MTAANGAKISSTSKAYLTILRAGIGPTNAPSGRLASETLATPRAASGTRPAQIDSSLSRLEEILPRPPQAVNQTAWMPV
jgi:hypothetical protein